VLEAVKKVVKPLIKLERGSLTRWARRASRGALFKLPPETPPGGKRRLGRKGEKGDEKARFVIDETGSV
jgi:hypothetical protein